MKIFQSIFLSLITRFSWMVILLAVALALLGGFFSWKFLKFDTNQDNLISRDQKYYQDYIAFLKNFGDWEYIYVVIEIAADQTQNAKSMAHHLVRDLESRPDLFDKATARVNVTGLLSGSLLFLDNAQFDQAMNILREKKDFLREFLAIRDASQWYQWLHTFLSDLKLPGWNEAEVKKFWPMLESALKAPFDPLSARQIESPLLIKKISGDYLDPDGYLFSDDGKLLMVQVLPHKNYASMEIVSEPLKYLRERLEVYQKKYPSIKIGLTGRPVLQNDEARVTGEDSSRAGVFSFLLVTGLYFLLVRRLRYALLGLFSLLIALSWTVGFVTFVYGSVNLLTISFAVILIALGIDYGIHFLVRYLRCLESGLDSLKSMMQVSHDNSPAILLGAITSAIAFSTSCFTEFEGLRQLGVIVGVGIIFCALSQVVVFPALIHLFHNPKNKVPPSFKTGPVPVILEFLMRRPALVLSAFAVVTLLGSPNLFRLRIDHNILALQDQTLESVRYEKIIQEHSKWSTWFLAHPVRDLDLLKRLQKKLDRLKSVSRTESLHDYIPQNQDKRIFTVKSVTHDILSHAVPAKNDPEYHGLELLERDFSTLAGRAFSNGLANEFAELSRIAYMLSDTRKEFLAGKISQSREFKKNLSALQRHLSRVLDPTSIGFYDLPELLRKRLKGADGDHALTIYPDHNVWEWDHLNQFITEVRSVIPDVTGAPVTTYESARLLNRGFTLVGSLTLAIVGVLLFLYFRRLMPMLQVFTTLLVSFVILATVMVLSDIPINLANFFALPVLIGTGVDHAIHILHDIKHKSSWKELLNDTLPAVIFSCLTTILSFGTLSFARHNGLASFGLVMAIGTTTILIVSVVGLTAWIVTASGD